MHRAAKDVHTSPTMLPCANAQASHAAPQDRAVRGSRIAWPRNPNPRRAKVLRLLPQRLSAVFRSLLRCALGTQTRWGAAMDTCENARGRTTASRCGHVRAGVMKTVLALRGPVDCLARSSCANAPQVYRGGLHQVARGEIGPGGPPRRAAHRCTGEAPTPQEQRFWERRPVRHSMRLCPPAFSQATAGGLVTTLMRLLCADECQASTWKGLRLPRCPEDLAHLWSDAAHAHPDTQRRKQVVRHPRPTTPHLRITLSAAPPPV